MANIFPDNAEAVKTIEDCFEYAMVDAYGDDEQATGWLTALEEILDDVKKVKLLGEEVEFDGLDLDDTSVVAVCKKNGKKAKIALSSIELTKPTKLQTLWLSAYKEWQKVNA